MKTVTLDVVALEYGYNQPLYDPISFHCRTGETIAILGANGRGKTTLLHTLIGAQAQLGGRIDSAHAIGFVPQSFSSPDYCVFDSVLMGRAAGIGPFNVPDADDEKIALEALALMGLDALAEHNVNTLSGGQRQLVLIARALAMQCQTLILDEPGAALDIYNQRRVLMLLHQLANQQHHSIIFSTHDPYHALRIADKVLLLLPERRWIFGSKDDILTEENLLLAYGVPVRQVQLEHHRALIPIFDLPAKAPQ